MVDRNSAPKEFACIWQSKWAGIITIEIEKTRIHFSSNAFLTISRLLYLRRRDRCKFEYLLSAQACIFGKASVKYPYIPHTFPCFSQRVDSTRILKWGVYVKLKVSYLRAFLWCKPDKPWSRQQGALEKTFLSEARQPEVRPSPFLYALTLTNLYC